MIKYNVSRIQNERLYIFGWPSFLGGADTKLAHLIPLLKHHYHITVVPNEFRHLQDSYWTRFLHWHEVEYKLIDDLPDKISGIGLSLSNQCFFTYGIANRARLKGLRIIWSSEMMWHHEGELDAVREGVIDKVLYVSEIQKRTLSIGYGELPWAITGNYIDPDAFPFRRPACDTFTIGRLSRASPEKYSEDFPVFYECLDLPGTRFRVMAWNQALAHKFRWHRFDQRWDLLEPMQENTAEFLSSLDLFVYPLGHTFVESWGRSTVEAMLTGAVPIVPHGHHFDDMILHGETGFLCTDISEYKEYSHRLLHDRKLLSDMAMACHQHAVGTICNREHNLNIWLEALQ